MHAHDQVPVVLGHLEEQVVARDAGVVDEDVDPAELVHHTLYGGLGGGRVHDVAPDADGPGAVPQLESAGSLLGGSLVEVEDRDRGALAGESLCDAESDAASGPGDDCDACVETTHVNS